jgi:hypothetical protein
MPRPTRRTRTTIRLPARVWNAYTSTSSPSSPSKTTSPKPTRCNYRPGSGAFHYPRKGAIKYLQPCLLPTCSNCRTWCPQQYIDDFEERLKMIREESPGPLREVELAALPSESSQKEHEECGLSERCAVNLRFRSIGSKAHYEDVLREQLQLVRCKAGILKKKKRSSIDALRGRGIKRVRFGKVVKLRFGSEMGRRRYVALMRERWLEGREV